VGELKGTAEEIKADLLWVAQESLRSNLVHGTAGNFSARLPDGNVALTPSSLEYDTMTLDDLVVCDLDGNVVEGARSPTTEKMLHLACLKRYDDIHAVIHCHAKFCTMFAITHQPIPCVIEEVEAFVGGDVPVANYKFTGSQELADEVSKWVGDRAAVLMANHGLLTVGKSPRDALKIASMVEITAEMVWGARALGDLVPLPDSTRQKMAPIYKMLRGM
jgi:L-fuculose-phosphate aldolase